MARATTPTHYVDRDTVIRVAADIADRDGWPNLTLSQVARELDRHVTSLYAHVDSLDGLRRDIAALALEELTDDVWRAAMGRVGEDALAAIARVYRAFALDHPGRAAAIFTVPWRDDAELQSKGLRLAEPIRATLASFGLDDAQVAAAHRVFTATVRGFVSSEATQHFSAADADASFDQAVRLFLVALASGAWPGRG